MINIDAINERFHKAYGSSNTPIEADSVVMIAQREEIEHLNSQIEAVKAFHHPVDMYLYAATSKVCVTCIELWPCQTTQALDVE